MATTDLMNTVLDEHEAELAKQAQRCVMTALDHSRAARIALVSDDTPTAQAPVLELPPKVLRLFADLLGQMARREPIALIPQKLELTTQDAANLLNVSRPFIVKEIEAGKLHYRKVGRHRRIEFKEVMRYKEAMQSRAEDALQELADQAQKLGLGY